MATNFFFFYSFEDKNLGRFAYPTFIKIVPRGFIITRLPLPCYVTTYQAVGMQFNT